MKSPEIVQQVRQVPIPDFLASLGIVPAYKTGGQLFYCSPKTNEKSPSLAVNPQKNVFYDWSGEGKGDIISLVQHLNGCTFLEAVQILETYSNSPLENSFSFSGQSYKTESTGIIVTNVKPLTHMALKQYVDKRGISHKIASRYLREIHYQTNGKQYFALGFSNDLGGYEIRNVLFQGSYPPKTVSTFPVVDSKTVILFEGFFDYLSALDYYQLKCFPVSVIVLNSLSFLSKVLSEIQSFEKVNVFFDNDEAGYRALQKVKSATSNVTDFSHTYKGYKDFNEFLCSSSLNTDSVSAT